MEINPFKLIEEVDNRESLWGYEKDIAVLNLEGRKERHQNKAKMILGVGLQYILYEELGLLNPKFIHYSDIANYKWVLIAFTSFYDVLAFLQIVDKIKKGKCILIAGGAGLNNPELFSDIIDYQIVGRAENIIAPILKGRIAEEIYTENSKGIEISQPKKLLKVGKWQEKSVGCSRGCKFCQYGWKFKNNKNRYLSSFGTEEVFFNDYEWDKVKQIYGITALDGFTEKRRIKIGKRITDDDFRRKMCEVYKGRRNAYSMRLYNIVGLPGERPREMEYLKKMFKKVDKKSNKRVNILISCTHFVPMKFTPLQNEKVNPINFRDYVYKHSYNKRFFSGDTFRVWFSSYITSPRTAMVEHACESVNNRTELVEKIKEINRKYSKL